MARKTFSIGSGLATAMTETVLNAHEYSGELHVEIISIAKIDLDPENPRDILLSREDVLSGIQKSDPHYSQKKEELDELYSLSESISSQGLINPVLVYKTANNYKLVAGERRLLASVLAKKDSIQAKILDKKPSPLKLSLLQWIENMERADLSLGEKLNNIQQIMTALKLEKGTDTISGLELADAIKISKTSAYDYIKAISAPEDIQALVQAGHIKNLKAISLIMEAASPLKEQLIEMSMAGEGIDRMQKFIKTFTMASAVKPASTKGRPVEKISFHATKNTQVARAIVESIIKNPSLAHLESVFSEIQWNNTATINLAFKKLITVLEKEFK